MNIDEFKAKSDRLELTLEFDRSDDGKMGHVLCEIWHDKLWECCADSFHEFVKEEFEMSLEDAFITMKVAASSGMFPAEIAEQIDRDIESLGI